MHAIKTLSIEDIDAIAYAADLRNDTATFELCVEALKGNSDALAAIEAIAAKSAALVTEGK